MTEQPQQAERTRDLERFVTFIDAIVAIAITLLVLPLVEISGETGLEEESVWHFLQHHQAEIYSFLLSFVVIARLWLAQHRLVRHMVDTAPGTTVALFAWTLTIVFLPFPTALVGRHGSDETTKVLYMGTLALSSLAIALLAWMLARHPQLRDLPDPPRIGPALTTAAVFLTALAISLVFPSTSYYPLLLLIVFDPTAGRWMLHGRRKGGAIEETA